MVDVFILLIKYLLFFILALSDIIIVYCSFKYASCGCDPKSHEQTKIQLLSAVIANICSVIGILLLNWYDGFHFSTNHVWQFIFLLLFVICLFILFLSGILHKLNELVLYSKIKNENYFKISEIAFFVSFFSILLGAIFLQIWLFLISFS